MISQKKNVNDWLSGFFSDLLTSQEKSDLYDYLADEGHKEEILAWQQTPIESRIEKNKVIITKY